MLIILELYGCGCWGHTSLQITGMHELWNVGKANGMSYVWHGGKTNETINACLIYFEEVELMNSYLWYFVIGSWLRLLRQLVSNSNWGLGMKYFQLNELKKALWSDLWDLAQACGHNVQHLIQIDEWTQITNDLPCRIYISHNIGVQCKYEIIVSVYECVGVQ